MRNDQEPLAARAKPRAAFGPAVWLLALGLVWLLAMGLRAYYLNTAMVYRPVRGDALQYHAYAWNLLHHLVFSKSAPGSLHVVADSFRDPGYPVFLAFWMGRFSDNSWYPAVLLSQGLLGASTVPLLMITARGWLADRWLVGAGVLMAVWPHSITITSFLLTETLFGFLCALALCLVVTAVRRGSHAWTAAAGVGFGMATLTNAILLPFAPLLAIALLRYRHIKPRLAATLIVSALVLPLAWGVRCSQLPAGSSSHNRALINFVQGSRSDYHSAYAEVFVGNPHGPRTLHAIQKEVDMTVADPARGLREVADRMLGSPLHYLGWYLRKPALLWDWRIRMGDRDIYVYPTAYSPFDRNPAFRVLASVCQAINPVLMMLALVGTFFALRPRRPRQLAGTAVAILVVYVTLLYSLFQAEPRYSIPFRGMEMLLAVFCAQHLAVWIASKRKAAMPAASEPGPEAKPLEGQRLPDL